MSTYDFKGLHDKEFEALSADLWEEKAPKAERLGAKRYLLAVSLLAISSALESAGICTEHLSPHSAGGHQ